MSKSVHRELAHFLERVKQLNPHEPEFHQAVEEVATDLMPFVLDHPLYQKEHVLERMTEPDRIIIFRVTWENDRGEIQTNRAWRVQFSNAIGPYKGGLRFHPTVNLSVLKFLGFEQVFKNSLTGLPMGGAKGGSNFDPKGKSEREIMRFCHAMMRELHRHIGENRDVPAGDIGVGARELGFMFGQYTRLRNEFTGTLTGKGLSFGGSLVRREATGHGAVYFLEQMLERRGEDLRGKVAAVSGSGNVALYAIEKLDELGAKVIAASDSGGTIHDPDGICGEKAQWLRELKEERRGRIYEYCERYPGSGYFEDQTPWHLPVQLALPCATQNELGEQDAQALIKNGVEAVVEGANMPSTSGARRQFHEAKILFGPGKAANAGGVAVSGLEQAQNAQRIAWSREQVDHKLQQIMQSIHSRCIEHGHAEDGFVDYARGANIAGFVKVADAMLAYGVV